MHSPRRSKLLSFGPSETLCSVAARLFICDSVDEMDVGEKGGSPFSLFRRRTYFNFSSSGSCRLEKAFATLIKEGSTVD